MSGSGERVVVNVVRPAPAGGLQPERAVRGLCQEALRLESLLEMEGWISSLLGQIWEQRRAAPPIEGLDYAFALGTSMMEQIARHGGPGARLTLHAVAIVDRGGLGVRCRQLADRLSAQPLPAWAACPGRVKVSRALAATIPGDGEVICLQGSGGGRITHTVAVYVDLRQEGIAKHIHLLEPIDHWAREVFGRDQALGAPAVRLAPARACQRVVAAIRRSDEHEDPVLGDGFAELRALALARTCPRVSARVDRAWLS